MKPVILVSLLWVPSLFAGYTYFSTDTFDTIDPAKWTQVALPDGTALISTASVPDGFPPNEYEVKMTLKLGDCSGSQTGILLTYLKATLDEAGNLATYYSVEVRQPAMVDGACKAWLVATKVVNGTPKVLFGTPIDAHDGMVIRSLARARDIMVFTEDLTGYFASDPDPIAEGKPGVGFRLLPASGANGIGKVELGPHESVRPTPPQFASDGSGVTAFPDRVEMQWSAGSDDPDGSSLWTYQLYRDDQYVANIASSATSFTDRPAGAAAGQKFTYRIYSIDYHVNYSSKVEFDVTLPAAGTAGASAVRIVNW